MEIPEFNEILTKITELKTLITDKDSHTHDSRYAAEWYNDEQCWELKGGMSLSTYRTNRFFQCKGGIADGKVGGRKVWSRTSVMEWVKLTDSELESYHEKYKTGAKRK